METPRKILLMMSGSIACAKATALISHWAKTGHEVRVACTRSVPQFVGPGTLEGLSGAPIFDDTFATGQAMEHIGLAQWADLVVICPATANLLGKLANGIADDAVSTLWQAAWGRGVPLFVVPAMNTHMWEYPATRENVGRLKSWGVHVLPTAEGDLACGEQGAGRMLEPEDILQRIGSLLAYDRPRARGRVLITGGGTRVPIDAVRYIGNHSSGRTSAALADHFTALGFDVTWLGATTAVQPDTAVDVVRFESFDDLKTALERLLSEQHFDLVVHAAAVSDYSFADAGEHKLPSGDEMTLRLVPNPKLLNAMRSQSSNPDIRIVGFKLTAGADDAAAGAAVRKLLGRGGVDAVVHNDMSEITAGRHRFHLYDDSAQLTAVCEDTAALARSLAGQFEETMNMETTS